MQYFVIGITLGVCIYIYTHTIVERRVASSITHLGTRLTFACKFFCILSSQNPPRIDLPSLRDMFIKATRFGVMLCSHWN